MKVGILSDTHIRKDRTLPRFVWESLLGVDKILHAGDIVNENVLEELALIAPVIAVGGNCDWWVKDLPDKIITDLGPFRIGITHGYLGKGSNTPERAYNTFSEDHVDLIVFGHSHIPYKSFHHGILLFNPGSPTERRGQPHYSLGMMTIEDGVFDVQHLFF
ncbi:MAG: metallophosphoesterase family protein [Peptococcaceae bacterium]|nr:metallophosphoesterase family protein [Peptococcaceae bacterium]